MALSFCLIIALSACLAQDKSLSQFKAHQLLESHPWERGLLWARGLTDWIAFFSNSFVIDLIHSTQLSKFIFEWQNFDDDFSSFKDNLLCLHSACHPVAEVSVFIDLKGFTYHRHLIFLFVVEIIGQKLSAMLLTRSI